MSRPTLLDRMVTEHMDRPRPPGVVAALDQRISTTLWMAGRSGLEFTEPVLLAALFGSTVHQGLLISTRPQGSLESLTRDELIEELGMAQSVLCQLIGDMRARAAS